MNVVSLALLPPTQQVLGIGPRLHCQLPSQIVQEIVSVLRRLVWLPNLDLLFYKVRVIPIENIHFCLRAERPVCTEL